MRREILEVAKVNGESAQAEQLVADLDSALVGLGELSFDVEQATIAVDADFLERIKSESLEVRQAANQFRGISDVGDTKHLPKSFSVQIFLAATRSSSGACGSPDLPARSAGAPRCG
jgi:hypothetical protein